MGGLEPEWSDGRTFGRTYLDGRTEIPPLGLQEDAQEEVAEGKVEVEEEAEGAGEEAEEGKRVMRRRRGEVEKEGEEEAEIKARRRKRKETDRSIHGKTCKSPFIPRYILTNER